MNKEYNPENKHFKSHKKTLKYHQSHQQQDQELRFAGISKLEFVNWLKALSAQERYLTLRVRAPELTRKLIELNTKFGQSWKIDFDVKKLPTRFIKNFLTSLQNFIDGLILISDKQYLDSIGFDFSFVGCPQKLYETLSNLLFGFHRIKNKNKNVMIEEHIKSLPHQKQEWVQELMKKIEEDYIIKKKNSWDPMILEKQKNQKKEFGNFWKNLNKSNKINFLYIDHEDVKSLVLELMGQSIKIDPKKLEDQINELFDLDKKQICNKVFKCKVKKCSIGTCAYYELLYESWRDFAARLKNQSRGNGKKKHKIQNKRQKSLGACSNETNQTQLKDSRIQMPQESLYGHIEQDILECANQISEESNKFHQKRVLSFERISAIFRLYGVSCKLFGSCASGITIKNSDIDIAIHQDILKYFKNHEDKKSQMNAALQFMSQIFQSLPWVSYQKVIETAAIPIIKLIINTKVQVNQEYFTEQYKDILNRKIQHSGEVHVDLTIETTEQEASNHLGVVSTQQINAWLQEIPTLRPIIIILKYYLAKKSLNETYLGGLNTYCLVVLVVSFIYSHQLQKQTNVGIAMCKLLNFYGWQFDEKNYGVDIRNRNQIYFEKSKTEENRFANLQVKDPLNQGKVMTRNCYEFEKIKDIFRSIYDNCFGKKEKMLKEQFIREKRKQVRKRIKEQSETQSGSEKDRLKNYFIQYII